MKKILWLVIVIIAMVMSEPVLTSSELTNLITQQRVDSENMEKQRQQDADVATYAMFDAYCAQREKEVHGTVVELQRLMVKEKGEVKNKVDEEIALCVMETFLNNSFCVTYATETKKMYIQTSQFLVPTGGRTTFILCSVLAVGYQVLTGSGKSFAPYPYNMRELSANTLRVYFEYLDSDRAPPSIWQSAYCSVVDCYTLA